MSWRTCAVVKQIQSNPIPHKEPVTRKMFQFDDVIMGGTPREETDGDNFKRFLSPVQLIALQWLMIKYFMNLSITFILFVYFRSIQCA